MSFDQAAPQAADLDEDGLGASFGARWKVLTRRANALFDAEDYEAAGTLYALACQEAEKIFSAAWNRDGDKAHEAAPMLAVSAANAANNACRRNDADTAADAFVDAVNTFVGALESQTAPKPLKMACARHLPRLLVQFKAKIEEMGADETRFTQSFERAHYAGLAFGRNEGF